MECRSGIFAIINFSLTASYDNRFGAGGGLSIWF